MNEPLISCTPFFGAVRVMDCDGEGAMSTIITGLEWILANLQLPAVVLMSIGGDATLLMDQACEALVNAGAVVVVAAGNSAEGSGGLVIRTRLLLIQCVILCKFGLWQPATVLKVDCLLLSYQV